MAEDGVVIAQAMVSVPLKIILLSFYLIGIAYY